MYLDKVESFRSANIFSTLSYAATLTFYMRMFFGGFYMFTESLSCNERFKQALMLPERDESVRDSKGQRDLWQTTPLSLLISEVIGRCDWPRSLLPLSLLRPTKQTMRISSLTITVQNTPEQVTIQLKSSISASGKVKCSG